MKYIYTPFDGGLSFTNHLCSCPHTFLTRAGDPGEGGWESYPHPSSINDMQYELSSRRNHVKNKDTNVSAGIPEALVMDNCRRCLRWRGPPCRVRWRLRYLHITHNPKRAMGLALGGCAVRALFGLAEGSHKQRFGNGRFD